LHWPLALRPAFDALFTIDDALAGVVITATQPALAAIKLAWWRERLVELDQGAVPAEPRLQAAAATLLPRGISGADLAALHDGWATLLHEEPDVELIGERGARLFVLGARLLGVHDPRLDSAGKLFAQEEEARGRPGTMHRPMDELNALAGYRFPKALRPLTALAALAARDARQGAEREPEATPGRSWTLLRHRLTGLI
jgi:phytoene synthase